MTRAFRSLAAASSLLLLWSFAGVAGAETIHVVRIDGSINPASANYLIRAIEEAPEAGASAVLVELDTPGGLVSSMKDILDTILNARVPVIVYVSPRGAWAGSAGVFITMSGHIAAMAPGTTIGAAHPVGIGGGSGPGKPPGGEGGEQEGKGGGPSGLRDFSMEKAENMLAAYAESIARERGRNVEWAEQAVRESVAVNEKEALEIGVIDLIASDVGDLLAQVQGRVVEVEGEPVTLDLEDAALVPVEMTLTQRFFNFLSEPDVAILLGMLGLLGLYVEFNNPGMLLPGILGAVSLTLAAIAFQILPFDWVGLLVMLVGVALLVAEVFVTSFGVLFASGILCLLVGGTMVFDRPDMSDLTVSFWTVLVPAVGAVAVFGGLVVFALSRSLFVPQTAGIDELVGLVGRAATPLAPRGKVFVRGEYWTAELAGGGEVSEGEAVEVCAVVGMELRVRPVRPA